MSIPFDSEIFGAPAPTEIPSALKDAKKPAFSRNNPAVAYARALASRKVDEEALEAFALVKVEDAVDPASYFQHVVHFSRS